MRAYKTEIHPTAEQKTLIHKTIGTTRFLYNRFITTNQERHKKNLPFMSGFEFSKMVNNELSNELPWIREVPSKAVKQSIMNADKSYKRFFEKKSGFPNFKQKSLNGSFYLIGTIKVQRHRVFLPKLKWVRLKEFGYIPQHNIKSATVSRRGNRYFVSILTDNEPEPVYKNQLTAPVGIDLGIKAILYTSTGEHVAGVYRNKRLMKLNQSLTRQQRKLSRKRKGSSNWYKQLVKVNTLHRRISSIKKDMRQKIVHRIVKNNPQYITIEDLNIKGMIKNRRLSNALQQTGLGYLVTLLKIKCRQYDIELRQVDRFYPSTQLCSTCNSRQKMKLSDRTYHCKNCGMKMDRDLNASINLVNATDYVVLT